MAAPAGLIVCRHLLPEAREACRLCGLGETALLPVEPRCDRPWPAWPGLLASAQPQPCSCDGVVVVGAHCLPPGDPPRGSPRAHVVRSSTCFALLAGETSVDTWVSRGCYLVVPGWLRQWRHAVAAWGYDAATARSHFGEFARTVLLLDTGTDPEAPALLHDFAQFMALGEEVSRVGLDLLGDRIFRAVQCPP